MQEKSQPTHTLKRAHTKPTYRRVLNIVLLSIVGIALLLFGTAAYFEVMYPLKYQEEVEIFAHKYELESTLVNSVINTESRFRPQARSNAGAMGLMQIMPYTAVWLAQEIGLEDFEIADLYEPSVNIEMGAYYLRYLLNKFEDVDMALAAYNAGEGNVASWLKRPEYSKDGRLVEIPFKETRGYVEKVNKNRRIYKNRKPWVLSH